MKNRLLHVFTLLALIGSTILAPVGTALAAPEWTCGSVRVTALNLTTRQVTVVLSHSNDNTEKIDLNWGDGSALLVIHAANTTTYLSNTQPHNYSSGAGSGPFIIKMRVFNTAGTESHDCSATVALNSCFATTTTESVTTMGANKTVTATVTYSGSASINWGDGSTTALPAGPQTNLVRSHTYAVAGAYTILLLIVDPDGNQRVCSRLTTNTPSAVTISNMSADSPEGALNLTAIAFALLGLVVLGQLALFAVIRRR